MQPWSGLQPGSSQNTAPITPALTLTFRCMLLADSVAWLWINRWMDLSHTSPLSQLYCS